MRWGAVQIYTFEHAAVRFGCLFFIILWCGEVFWREKSFGASRFC